MARFDYRAVDGTGACRDGSLEATNEGAARADLARRRLVPLRVVASTQSRALAAPSPSRNGKLKGAALAMVTRQLATLIRVVPVEEALQTIALQTERIALRRILRDTHAGVVEGFRLSEAMTRQGRAFPALYRAMIAAGETSSALPDILDRLAELLEREQETRSKMLTTLIYPAALAGTAIIVVIALMVFVVPKVVDQFDSMGQTLPLLTRLVIALSDGLRHWGWLLVLLGAGAGVSASQALKRPHLRRAWDGFLLRLPGIGRLIRDLNAARLARTLATMLASGLPVLDGLQLVARTISNSVLREAVEAMAAAIREGASLSSSMRRAGVFPPLLVHMTASGESSGRLDAMLSGAADYLEREFRTVTAVALSLLEPAIIIVMGAVVATIVLSILLPILQINTMALR
jgi:general secretion pathway protein F